MNRDALKLEKCVNEYIQSFSDRIKKQRDKVFQKGELADIRAEITQDWYVANLFDVTHVITCGVAKRPEYVEEGIPFLSAQNARPFKANLDKIKYVSHEAFETLTVGSKPEKGDILYTRVGNCGEAAKITFDFDFAIYVSLTLIKPVRVILNSDYLVAFLNSKYGLSQAGQGAIGIGLKNLNVDNVRRYVIPLPPLAEQQQIAQKLDQLLAQVDTLKTRLDNIPKILKRFRQSVLAAAVSGKLTEEWRGQNPHATTEKLLEGFQVLPLPPRYKSRSTSFIQGVHATAVGKPKGKLTSAWDWVPIVSVARMESGHTPSRSVSAYWGGDVNWIGIKDAKNNHAKTILETEQTTNDLGLANSAARLLPKNTVCISRTASVGYVVRMGKSMATSQDFVNWVPTEVVDPDWLKWLFVAEKESLFRFGKGSTHTTVYFPEWLAMHIALPHKEEQIEIVRKIEELFTFADQIEQRVKDAQSRVNNLTQSILGKAFKGELTADWRAANPDLITGENSAAALLERIKAERAAMAPKKKTRVKKVRKL